MFRRILKKITKLKKVKYWFRNIFGFSRTETNGSIVLIILMVLMFILPPLLKKINSTNINYEADKAILDSMMAVFDKKDIIEDTTLLAYSTPEYFSFNPNVVSEEIFISFGIPKKVASRIINYRNKGGKFYIKNDLLKVYDFPEEKYKELHPFIDLPERKPTSFKASPKTKIYTAPRNIIKDKKPVIFDINSADTVQLKAIKGIGSVLSTRILKYRNSLGGFISKHQFAEIYGLDEQVMQQLILMSNIEADFQPQKINVNLAEVQQLASHPYISKKVAQRIVAFREQHGPFNKSDLLSGVKELDEEFKEKIYPYLEF